MFPKWRLGERVCGFAPLIFEQSFETKNVCKLKRSLRGEAIPKAWLTIPQHPFKSWVYAKSDQSHYAQQTFW